MTRGALAIRLSYARHWLRFKAKTLCRPYISITPCGGQWAASQMPFLQRHWTQRYRIIRRGRWGFTLYGYHTRYLVSWREFAEGPCNFETFAWLAARP